MNRPLAYIHPEAKIENNVIIGPFSSIASDVEIGEGTWIGPNVTIMEGAKIGKNCKIFPGTVISAEPQDLKYEGERTRVIIGNNTVIRECVTINRGTKALGYTKIGDNCLIMATVHIAHDCIIGDHVIIVNGVGLAGHIEVGSHAFIGGMSAAHQFTKIGEYAFIAGASQIRKDIPPFVKAARNPISYVGINSIGLRRKGFSPEKIWEIQSIYRALFQQKNNVAQALSLIEAEFVATSERDQIIQFIQSSARGIMKGYNQNTI